MKKILLLAVAAIMAAGAVQAKTADELRIYLNPGHGSWGPNDRPMATISYPMLPETGRPDTNGFYESNTNLWKSIQTRAQLIKMGVKPENITMSRWFNGPYPYVQGAEDAEIYNRPLSEICEEVEIGNYDMFLSHHSNALTDGTATNYPLMLYRGNDGEGGDLAPGSRAMGLTCWPLFYTNEIDPMTNYSPTSPNVRGDINFYGSSSTRVDPNTGIAYTGYLGVLKHGAPGFLVEGYFHTYQPARHRALNVDYCHQEGIRIARGIGEYFGLTPDSKGYIMGTVKDLHNHLVHNLYNYSAGTMDQWAPINGAVVILYKNGQEVARYTTDDNYNGVFVFENLDPGTYTLAVEAEGFKPLGEYSPADVDSQWKEWIAKAAGNIVVEANKTTYEVALLEDNEYVVPDDLYQNYPEPELPGYVSAPERLNLVCDEGTEYEFDGKIMRMLVRGDSTVVLTNAEDGTPHLYLINNVDKVIVKELSIDGIAPAEPNNAGFYSRLKDICFTADNQLVGINSVQTQFGAGQVNEGYERGTLRLFKWADFDSDPVEWVTTQSSANFYYYRAQSLAIDGGADDCTVTIAGTNDAASSAGGMRFLKLTIVNNQITSTVYTEKTVNATSNFTRDKVGEPQIVLSPRNDDQVMLDGENTLLMEVATAKTNGTDSEIVGRFEGDEIDIPVVGTSFFKYAQHQYMVTPYIAPDRGEAVNVGGIKLYDITAGLDQAALVATTNTDLAPLATQFMATGAAVKGEDINLYLMQDNKITKWQALPQDQPKVKGIYAYDLRNTNDGDNYTFTFMANDDANEAFISFRDSETNDVLLTLPIENVLCGENQITVSKDMFPAMPEGSDELRLTWEITLAGDPITRISMLNDPDQFSFNRIGNVVDNSPESEYFGRLYLVNRIGSSNTSNGIWAYNPDWTPINTEPISGEYTLGNPFRLATDQYGTVYLSNWADGARSGVYKFNPATLSGDLEPFFIGSHASDGTITNENGEMMCTSTPSVFIAGKGADTHMYCHLEDYNNDISQYNIGNEDGSIIDSWNQAPSRLWGVGAKLISTHAAVIGESEDGGIWIVQNRAGGNNNASVPSIMYVNNEGTIVYNSGTVGNPIHDHLNGTQYAAGAISADGTELVVNQPDGTLKFFEVEYNSDGVPTLTWKYDYKHGVGNLVTQINYDYAGNLYVSAGKLAILSMPTDENCNTTPARSEFDVILTQTTGVAEVKTNKTVVSERYYDVRGIEYNQPVEGVNIIVRTYSDGSTQSVKVIK